MSRQRPARSLAVTVFAAAMLTAACTEEARNDVAKSAFVKAANLKCKLSKAEAKVAWDLADQLGADEQASVAMKAAEQSTDRLLAELDRLDGPVDVAEELKGALRSSRDVVIDVSQGKVSPEDGRAKLEELRERARAEGFGECVSL